MKSKVVSLQEAVASLENGAHMSFSGFGQSMGPLAFVREMIRQGIRDLELTAVGEAWSVDLLCGAGAISRIRLSNFMFEGWGRCRNFSRVVEQGKVQVEDYSHFGLINRFFAGAIGVPFMPTKVMNGTDIVNIRGFDGEQKYMPFHCPFTGETVGLVPQVRPDVAVIHASRADPFGNVQLFGISSHTEVIAKAAKKVIVTVEEIVDESVIRKDPSRTIIPGFMVDYVVHCPFGAHPTGMFMYYDYDKQHIDYYVQATRTEEGTAAYLKEFVYGTRDETEYLEKIGLERLMEIKADPYFGYSLKNRGELS